jgi:predicted nucleic acid-binding protein
MALQVTTSSLLVLDSGIIGFVTNPSLSSEALRCSHWLKSLLIQQIPIAIAEISDYEIRRELLRADKMRGLMSLDILKANLLYISITTNMMLKAAELWAQARKHGKPTAAPESLDADVILAAQTIITATVRGYDPVIASTNVRHLAHFVQAARWQDIEPIR